MKEKMRELRSHMETMLIGLGIGNLVGIAPISEYQKTLIFGITVSVLIIGMCITYWVEAYAKNRDRQ